MNRPESLTECRIPETARVIQEQLDGQNIPWSATPWGHC